MNKAIEGLLLSPADAQLLQGLIERERLRIQTLKAPRPLLELPQSPDIYLAYAPSGGIPAYTAHPGTGSVDQTAASRDCSLYRISDAGSTSGDILPIGVTRRIFNVTDTAIDGGTLFLAVKDKVGKWIASPLAAGGGESNAFSGCKIYNSTDQSVAAGPISYTTLTFDTEVFDTDSYHSTSSNTARMIAPVSGYYLVGAQVAWSSSVVSGKHCYISILTNKSTPIQARVEADKGAGVLVQQVSCLIYLAVTEYASIQVRQDDTVSRDVIAGVGSTFAWMYKVGI